ncbi:DUF7706 family protein [Photorhabdus khanii]
MICALAVNDEEEYQIKDAIYKLQSVLTYNSYSPQ